MKNEIILQSANGEALTILEGKALDPKYPNKIAIVGDINSISAFLKNRATGHSSQAVDKSRAVVTVDKDNMNILLELDPEYPFGATVLGSLELSKELKIFCINQAKTFKREELVHLLRFNRLAFDNKEQHEKMLQAYMAFTAKTSADLAASNDTRGNKAATINKEVSTNIPTEFTLLIPIFKGKDAMRFRVEICLDVTDGGARFWFESTELHELIETQRDIIFNEELKSCAGFVIINK
jgi:hypothetical protein